LTCSALLFPISKRQDDPVETFYSGDIPVPRRVDGLNYYLERPGFVAGHPQELTSYALRREAANAIDCPEVGEVRWNRIMGHSRADVFRRHYIMMYRTVTIDTKRFSWCCQPSRLDQKYQDYECQERFPCSCGSEQRHVEGYRKRS